MTTVDKFDFLETREGNIVSTEDRRLTLAYEGLSDVPQYLIDDYGPIVEILDLSHNKLTNLGFISRFKVLTTLILDHNYISSEVELPVIPTVTTLWINHNFVDKLHPFVQTLSKSFKNLKFLSLMGNTGAPSYLNGGTYYEYLQYRLFVISRLPNLKYLDDRPVTADQRKEADRIFGRPFYHTLMEVQFPQYLQQIQQKFKHLVDSMARPSGNGNININTESSTFSRCHSFDLNTTEDSTPLRGNGRNRVI